MCELLNTKSKLRMLLLHDHPEYLQDCCDLLNSQWKRSETARLHSLSKSSSSFPCSLLLVECQDNKETLIGHCKVCRVLHCQKSCWIESFIISSNRRGQGLGKYFLKAAEEFSTISGFSTVYLMTEDKEDFYKHMGYQECQPVCAISGSYQPPTKLLNYGLPEPVNIGQFEKPAEDSSFNSSPGLPPPPPPPPILTNVKSTNIRGKKCVWMMRKL